MRVVIIADNPLTAEGIRRELRHVPSFEVIGYVDGRTDCGATVAGANAELVAIDEMRSSEDLLARIGEARAAAPEAKLVLLTARMDSVWLSEAAAAGIDAAVAKTLHASGLGTMLRQVAEGNVFHAFTHRTEPARPTPEELGLTERELEILLLVASGSSNPRIAAKLWVSEQTVKFHLSNTYRKLGVRNRTEASHYAHMRRLVQTDTAPTTGRAA